MSASLNSEPKIDLATLRSRLETLKADRAEDAQAVRSFREQAREARARGDSDATVSELLRQHREAQDRLANTDDAIKEIEEALPVFAALEVSRAAKARLLGIKKGFGSLLNEFEEDDRAIADAVQVLAERVQCKNDRYERLTDLRIEAMVLSEIAKIEMPDLQMPARPASSEIAKQALIRARALRLSEPRQLPRDLASFPYSSGIGWTLKAALERIDGTPSAALLQEAGAGIFTDEERWNARRVRLSQESRDRKDAARQAEIDALDGWLRKQLENGPVGRDSVTQAAQRAGIKIHGSGHLTLNQALTRVGVFTVVRADDPMPPPAYWTIRRADDFEVPRGEIRSSQMAASMR